MKKIVKKYIHIFVAISIGAIGALLNGNIICTWFRHYWRYTVQDWLIEKGCGQLAGIVGVIDIYLSDWVTAFFIGFLIALVFKKKFKIVTLFCGIAYIFTVDIYLLFTQPKFVALYDNYNFRCFLYLIIFRTITLALMFLGLFLVKTITKKRELKIIVISSILATILAAVIIRYSEKTFDFIVFRITLIPKNFSFAILTALFAAAICELCRKNKIKSFWIHIIISIVFFNILYSGLLDRHYDNLLKEKRYKKPARIGVLLGYLNNKREGKECKGQYCNIPPKTWIENFSDQSLFEAKEIYWDKISNKWAVIINPFGELYLEEDVLNKKTFKRIKNFVNEGGIYVSVASYPFWYIWDSALSRKISITPEKYIPFSGYEQHIKDTLVYENFRLEVIPLDVLISPKFQGEKVLQDEAGYEYFCKLIHSGEKKEISFKRAIKESDDPDDKSIIPALKFSYNATEYYPLCAFRYGKGYFIFSCMILNDENGEEFKIVINAIKGLSKYIQTEKWLDEIERNREYWAALAE